MFRFVALFALVSCAFAGSLPDDLDGRIVNGESTTIQKHPHQVSLQKGGSHFCGGSIVNENTIVTAAHCMTGVKPADIKVRLGTTYWKEGGEVVSVRNIASHPDYSSQTNVNDVAVIKLATPVRESNTVKYIKLATVDPPTGTRAVVTGWGTKCFLTCITLPNELQEVEVDIVRYEDCRSDKYKYGASILQTMICAYEANKDACQGDSGGPLVVNNLLVGVVSWGSGCARIDYPGVYGDIAATYDWLDKTIKTL